MLEEGAIDAVVDSRDPEIPVNGSSRPHLSPPTISLVGYISEASDRNAGLPVNPRELPARLSALVRRVAPGKRGQPALSLAALRRLPRDARHAILQMQAEQDVLVVVSEAPPKMLMPPGCLACSSMPIAQADRMMLLKVQLIERHRRHSSCRRGSSRASRFSRSSDARTAIPRASTSAAYRCRACRRSRPVRSTC